MASTAFDRRSATSLGDARFRTMAWLLLTLTACSTPSATPTLAFNPSCALVVGELAPTSTIVGGQRFPTDPQLLISERRGPPDDSRWPYIGQHHIPQPVVIPGTTPTEFKWPAIRDVKEVTVSTGAGYQVHVLVAVFGIGLADVADMIQDPDGTWRPLQALDNTVETGRPGGPLGIDVGRAGRFSRVSGASVAGKLHVCAVETDGQIERNIFDPATSRFEGWTDIELRVGETGRFIDVACASVFNPATNVEELHVCGVTDDGRLWHSRESPFRTFSAFGDVEGVAGEGGEFTRVDCAGNAGQLHLVGITTRGVPWRTVRNATSWLPVENVHDAIYPSTPVIYRDVAIGFCNWDVPRDGERDVSQLNVVLTERNTNKIWHTIRATNPVQWSAAPAPGNWRPVQDLSPVINRTSTSPVPPTTTTALWGGFSIGDRPFRPY